MPGTASEFRTEHREDYHPDNSYDFLLRNPQDFYNYYIETTNPELALEIEAVKGPAKATSTSWSQGQDHNYRGQLRDDSPALKFYETHRDIQSAMEEWDTPNEYREILAHHVADTVAAPMENFIEQFKRTENYAAAFHPEGVQDPETFNQIMETVAQGMDQNLEKAKEELYTGLMDDNQAVYTSGLDRITSTGNPDEFRENIVAGDFHNRYYDPHITHAISELEHSRTGRMADELTELLAARDAQHDHIGAAELLSDQDLRETYQDFTSTFPQAEVVRLNHKMAYNDANITVDIDYDDAPLRNSDRATFQALVYEDRFWDDAYDTYISLNRENI